MRRIASWTTLAALVLNLCAPCAEAGRRRYISPTGDDNLNTGLTVGSPWRTWSKMTNNLSGQDTVVAARGTYSDAIAPSVYWIGIPYVVIIGDSVTPNTTVIPGLNISATAGNRRFDGWTVNGFRVNGNATVAENEGFTNAEADGINLRNIRVRGDLTMTDVDGNLSYVTAGFGPDTASSATRIFGEAEGVAQTWNNCSFEACPSPASSYSDYALQFEAKQWWSHGFTVTANNCGIRVYGPHGWNPPKPTFFRGWKSSRFTDCRFELVDSTNSNTAMTQGLLFRDRVQFNTFLRDTFIARTVRSGVGSGAIQSPGSGSGGNENGSNEGNNNTWRYCWFQSNVPSNSTAGGTVGFVWQIQPGDSFYRNVVVCSTNTAEAGFVVNNVQGVGYIGNNTLYNRGKGGAFMLNHDGDQCAYMTGKVTVENNIFYSRSTDTTSTDYAAIAKWRASLRTQDYYDSDFNLYAHYGYSNGIRSVKAGVCGSSFVLFTPGGMNTQFGIDGNSLYGSPRFTDSSFANFNATPLSDSRARCSGRDGVTIGAMDTDCIRPYAIEDVNVGYASPTQAAVTWSATGDDSLTGSCVSYDLRYSTSPITEANWSSATTVSGEPTPSTSGTRESKIIEGLSAGTRYYFAVKASDEYANPSALSNVATIITPLAGPDIAEP